jgi:hypothetical protein
MDKPKNSIVNHFPSAFKIPFQFGNIDLINPMLVISQRMTGIFVNLTHQKIS